MRWVVVYNKETTNYNNQIKITIMGPGLCPGRAAGDPARLHMLNIINFHYN
jgi:hypothetical protein